MTPISSQVIVTTAGIPMPLGSLQINGPLKVKALVGNTGLIFIGNDGEGEVSEISGLELDPGEEVTFFWVGNLGSIILDAEVSGEGASWLSLNL